MRTKQSWVWAIFLSVVMILSLIVDEKNASAQRRRPRVPANAQCTDSDNSPRDPNQAGRGEDRLTGGNTRYYSSQSRRYRTVTDSCNDQGQLVENYCDPVITYSYGRATTACEEGEACANGRCTEPIVLDRCGTPPLGWESGATYVLNQDIEWPGGDNYRGREYVCFRIEGRENITLDCQGHSITGEDESLGTGIKFYNMRNSKIQNCNISNFITDLDISGLESSEFHSNTSTSGINYERDRGGNRFINNTSCDEGIHCGVNVILDGSGNHLGYDVWDSGNCPTNGPRAEVYTPCERN